jgi:hypothetical protein
VAGIKRRNAIQNTKDICDPPPWKNDVILRQVRQGRITNLILSCWAGVMLFNDQPNTLCRRVAFPIGLLKDSLRGLGSLHGMT